MMMIPNSAQNLGRRVNVNLYSKPLVSRMTSARSHNAGEQALQLKDSYLLSISQCSRQVQYRILHMYIYIKLLTGVDNLSPQWEAGVGKKSSCSVFLSCYSSVLSLKPR